MVECHLVGEMNKSSAIYNIIPVSALLQSSCTKLKFWTQFSFCTWANFSVHILFPC